MHGRAEEDRRAVNNPSVSPTHPPCVFCTNINVLPISQFRQKFIQQKWNLLGSDLAWFVQLIVEREQKSTKAIVCVSYWLFSWMKPIEYVQWTVGELIATNVITLWQEEIGSFHRFYHQMFSVVKIDAWTWNDNSIFISKRAAVNNIEFKSL